MSLNNLAVLYQSQGRYADAEPLLRRSLAICEKALGPDHPECGHVAQQPGVTVSIARAATRTPSRSSSAASPSVRRRLDPIILDVGRPLNNLAALYESQGRYAEAGAALQAQPRHP